MELSLLEGNIIGVVTTQIFSNPGYHNNKIKDIIGDKYADALKIVNLDFAYGEKLFMDLDASKQNKVRLAEQLNNKVIILEDFFKGMNNKEIIFYKNLLKKISSYHKKIILLSHHVNDFLNLVDRVYVIKDDTIVYQTADLKNEELYNYVSRPPIIEFVYLSRQKGIKLDYYTEFNDLLKAIYRLKA